MWEKFTERSRRIVYKAQEEAHRHGHPKVGTEHLLLGILDERDSLAARVLATLTGNLEELRATIIASLPPSAGGPSRHIGLTSSARHAIALAQDESTQQGQQDIASGHLLIGLLRCQEGGSSQVLAKAGVTLGAARDEINAELSGRHGAERGEDVRVGEHATLKSLPPLVRGAIGRQWDHLSYRARAAVEAALALAAERGGTLVTPEHLLAGVVADTESAFARLLARARIPIADLQADAKAALPRKGNPREVDRQMELRAATKTVIDQAELSARMAGDGTVGTIHLVVGLLSNEESKAAEILRGHGLDLARLRELAAEMRTSGVAPMDLAALSGLTIKQLLSRSSLRGCNLLRISDLTPGDVAVVFAVTKKLKDMPPADAAGILRGKNLAMVFQKPSLRTRVTFDIGMNHLGGHAIHLGPDEIGVGERETPKDVARNLAEWVDGIVTRTFTHEMAEEIAENCDIPVINGLSDLEHPCQALADFYTLLEFKGDLPGLTLAYIGDGNNVCRSLMELAARTGVHMRVASPPGYEPDEAFTGEMSKLAGESGADVFVTNDPVEAVKDADAVYTDVWASMGQEAEAAERQQRFQGFQLNLELLKGAKPDAVVLHCQPAHRGEEISSEAMDSPNSVIFPQAGNRLHVQKALLALML